MSHTYALLEVSPATYVEIRRKLEEAGYQHALHDNGVIDMHGIALEQPLKHSGGCSNQNVLDPLGAYRGVEACGCRKR